ncbi:MAG TPA: DNA repair exonuclease [Polyangiaceae bacterium]|nr:DNA repair exonuclease [Polyangiaceae bacterium]
MRASAVSGFTLVHAADLHLGGRRWLRSEPEDGEFAEAVRRADRLALRALVDLCLSENARLLLLSGDILDGWCRDHRIALELVKELFRLRDAGCEAALLLGNHDVRTRFARPLLLPEWAFVIGTRGPETRVLDELGVALHGWSAPEVKGDVDVAALYPPPVTDLLNIGLLHTSAEGRRGHADYAPCSRRTLRTHGYDYWALGHVHTREVISTDPWIVFPGNLQGRGSRETGSKGATVVRVQDGRILGAEHRDLAPVRFETIVANAEDAERFDDLLRAASEALARLTDDARARRVIARVVLSGENAAAAALRVPSRRRGAGLRAVARDVAPDRIWVDEAWVDGGPVAGAFGIDLASAP